MMGVVHIHGYKLVVNNSDIGEYILLFRNNLLPSGPGRPVNINGNDLSFGSIQIRTEIENIIIVVYVPITGIESIQQLDDFVLSTASTDRFPHLQTGLGISHHR